MSYDRSVDVHAHALIQPVDALAQRDEGYSTDIVRQARWDGIDSISHNAKLLMTRYLPALTDLEVRLATMDRMGIDVQAVSLSPTQYYHWADTRLAEQLVLRANEGLAELCARRPDRLVGLATVALQHPAMAVEQLTHAIRSLGMRGVQISTHVAGMELDDTRLDAFWGRAEELEALVFLHPLGCTLAERLDRHYLSNVVGQPAETTVALSHLIFGGVLDRFPRLTVCAAHGGGYLPHSIGRSEHAYDVRPECKRPRLRPREYLRRIWFDSLVYDPGVLRSLLAVAGPSQVVLGTDYPFDMGVEDPVARLADAGLSLEDSARVRGANLARLLKLTGAA